jgi:hypothetical protein
MINDEFNIGIELIDVPDFTSIDVRLCFNPNILEVATVTQGSFPQTGEVISIQVDNEHGLIDYAVGTLSSAESGSGTVLNITFKAKNKGVGSITFSLTSPRKTLILYETQEISFTAIPGSVKVEIVYGILTSVTIDPPTSTVEMKGSQSFTAQGLNQYGYPIVGATYTWTLDKGIGTLNTTTGKTVIFTAEGVGTGNLYVKVVFGTQTVTAIAKITVVKGKPAYIIIDPATATIETKGTMAFTATAYNQYGF